ncbi:CoA-binding protein [Falsirhodobacter sp. 20TX0035]|uniref:CoA-binding protein n=1 Tax=Falsirhodobacter sp. 20TX0035 TaxID=3022019 RepID=UPI00232F0BBC|nr:CoA-binding protein [Falsirhodobacter sp. 20TX0035]MDB6452094.1 CoA-binding protein [Falsirhodobacter sp. 20TX0035]
MTDDTIRDILTSTRTIAVVGWSPNPARPSHQVAAFLKARGYRVLPVNPGQAGTEALGETVVADLASLPVAVDMVDIFRRSEEVLPVVEQAVALKGVKTVWMQLGIANAQARALAESHGLQVVENRCPAIEIPRLSV